MEHHSNVVPWHFLRERQGAVIKWAPVDDEGNFLIDEFDKLLTPRTKLVAITHMSNMLGTVVPVKEVVRLAHARGIPVLVDGSQAAVHLAIDVQDIDCDFYVFTGHKLYGPTGIGVLYAKHEHLVAMRPYNGGGEMIREVARDWVTYGDPPHKFEAGTPAIVEAVGLGAAIDYVNSIGKERIAAHEQDIAIGKVWPREGLRAVAIQDCDQRESRIVLEIDHAARRPDVRRQIDLIDHQKVRAGDAWPSLGWNLVAGGHVDHIDGQVRKLRREGGRQVVAA